MLGGGILMVIGSFLNWGPSTSGLSTDALGLLGIFTLLFGAAIAAVAGIRSFAPQTSLPSEIAGLSLNKICGIFSLTIFLWTFGTISRSGVKFGIHLTWIAAAIATVGVVMTMMDEDGASASSI